MIYWFYRKTIPYNWRCSIACMTIGGTWGGEELSTDCLSIKQDAEADDDRSVNASISRDFQLIDSKGWSLFEEVLLSVFGLEFSIDDLELWDRLEPDECRLTLGESSGASGVPGAVVDDIDGVPSLRFFWGFLGSIDSGLPCAETALCRGIANTPFSIKKIK